MQTRYLLPLAMSVALGTTAAFAADRPAPARGHHHRHMDHKDMARHHKNRCADRYAHAVGTMAYLETRLHLKGSQDAAFARWKDVVLASAKTRADACAAMKMPEHRPGVVEMAKFREKRLEMRLEGLKAQMAALETLTAALDQNQEHILGRTLRRMMHHRGDHERRGHRGDGHWRGDRGRHDGPMRDGPPPADNG